MYSIPAPLIVYFSIFFLGVLVFLVISISNIYHAYRFGYRTGANKTMIAVYCIVALLLLAGSSWYVITVYKAEKIKVQTLE